MKMMRFIFALPIFDVAVLPLHKQHCDLCQHPYNPQWKINTSETAVILPCGHIFGHFCVRKWLSPFEKKRTRCPEPRCRMVFPCPMNSRVSNGQSIVGGRLYPSLPPMIMDREDSNNGDDEDENDEDDSMTTEDLVSELAAHASARDIEDQDPFRQVQAITASVDSGEEDDNLSLTQSGNELSSRLAGGKMPKWRFLSKWDYSK